MDKHIRVDSLFRPEAQAGVKLVKKDDYDTTAFIGNLPYIVNEEELRTHFAKFGTILNVRLVRDPKTYIGKGIGYI
jgi:nucleolar protein 12